MLIFLFLQRLSTRLGKVWEMGVEHCALSVGNPPLIFIFTLKWKSLKEIFVYAAQEAIFPFKFLFLFFYEKISDNFIYERNVFMLRWGFKSREEGSEWIKMEEQPSLVMHHLTEEKLEENSNVKRKEISIKRI